MLHVELAWHAPTTYSSRNNETLRSECLAPWLRDGNVEVSNSAHAKYTLITIRGEPGHPGFLLEISSLLSGIGMCIREADIMSDNDGTDGTPASGGTHHDFSAGRCGGCSRALVTNPYACVG